MTSRFRSARLLGRAFASAAALVAGVSGAAAEEGVDVPSGFWRTISVIESEFDGGVSARTEVRDVCIASGVLAPEALFKTEAGCRWSALEVVGQEMRFDLVCDGAGAEGEGVMRGEVRFVAEGARGVGRIEMGGASGGRPTRMIVTMTSERIGGC